MFAKYKGSSLMETIVLFMLLAFILTPYVGPILQGLPLLVYMVALYRKESSLSTAPVLLVLSSLVLLGLSIAVAIDVLPSIEDEEQALNSISTLHLAKDRTIMISTVVFWFMTLTLICVNLGIALPAST